MDSVLSDRLDGMAGPTPDANDEAGASDVSLDDNGGGGDVVDEVDEASERYTIDELAGLSGVPSRTIRFYQSNGTLPPPEKRGRVAYYGAEHLERLRTIAELQDRGLRLDAIRDVLARIEAGKDSLHNWLGFGDELQAPWLDERPMVLTQAELDGRFTDLRSGIVGRLERGGMLERQGNTRPATYLVRSPALLDIAVRLEQAGVDLEVAFGASEIMRKRLARAAEELVPYFAEHAGRGFGRDSNPDEVAHAYQSLRPLGMQAVQVIFAQEMERALRRFVESGKVLSPPKSGSRPPSSRSSSRGSSRSHRSRH